MEKLATLEIPSMAITLETFCKGNATLGYKMTVGGDTLFEGDDYRPSPTWATGGLDSLVSLLGFLTLRPGDTDAEYFRDYTPEQLGWVDGRLCDYLRVLVSDLEDTESEHHAEALKIVLHTIH